MRRSTRRARWTRALRTAPRCTKRPGDGPLLPCEAGEAATRVDESGVVRSPLVAAAVPDGLLEAARVVALRCLCRETSCELSCANLLRSQPGCRVNARLSLADCGRCGRAGRAERGTGTDRRRRRPVAGGRRVVVVRLAVLRVPAPVLALVQRLPARADASGSRWPVCEPVGWFPGCCDWKSVACARAAANAACRSFSESVNAD
jgi:hypothetical protein